MKMATGRLFWKFFFAFWGTVVAAGLMVALGLMLAAEPRNDQLQPVSSPRAAALVNRAARVLAQEGSEALRESLRRRHQRQHRAPPLFIVDREGKDLLGRPLPPGSLIQVRSVARLGDVAANEPAVRHVAIDGEEYLLFVAAPPHPGPRGRHPLVPWLLIGAGLLASLGFSAILARYFARPVGYLRAAFAAAADGRLDERVQPRMGGRRDEIADLGRHFDAMAGRLHTLIGAQRQLLHDVSHELRSPLARLQAAVGLARQNPARVEATLDRIERETVRLDELVGELLTLSRLEAGVSGNARESLDLVGLIAAVAEDARFEAQAAGRELRFEAPPGEICAEVYPELLHRAFENVIRNAVRFTAHGTAVMVELRPEPAAGLIVSVCDRGPGVPEADLPHIFEPFYRSANGPATDGFGLGLAIARRAVEAHGGSISAHNHKGGGLCVEIRLPLR